MDYTVVCNSVWLYIFVAVILLGCIGQTIIMMNKAIKRAKLMGFTSGQIKKIILNAIIVSIVPTIPVLVVFLSLVPLLGSPLPWLRLSVIGSATFESMAASIGVESVGESLTIGGLTIIGWISACWCMSLGGSTSLVWSTLAIKPISELYEKAENINLKLVITIGSGCLIGVMAYATVNFGLSALNTKGIVFLSSFILGSILMYIQKKRPDQKWINDFLMAICMVFGMTMACIVL